MLRFLAAPVLLLAAAASPCRASGLAPAELSVWNDPAFQKRFAESYVAETEIEPTLTKGERDQMQRVLELMTAGGAEDLDKAAAMLERGRGKGSSAAIDFTLANIHFQRERLGEAAAAYEIATEKFRKFRRAWRNLGLVRVRQNELAKALPALTKVIELGGADAITFGLLGFAHAGVDDDLAAESAYRMAILMDPATMDWKMGLARSLFRQERFADAAALCGQLIAKQPERADLWLLQANAYLGLEQPRRAAENYEIVDRMGRSTAESLTMLGDIYVNEDLFDLAVERHRGAIEMSPGGTLDRALRAAKVMAARGGLDATAELVDHLESRAADRLTDEQRKDLLKLRARIAVARGAGDEEAAILEEIVALDPLDGDALILLGRHSQRSGDSAKAVFYYQRAAGIPEHEADAKVRHAELLVQERKYGEALPLLRRAQMLNPRDKVERFLEQVAQLAR